MIAEDVKDDICTGRGRMEEEGGGRRMEPREEERGVFCSTPVCLKVTDRDEQMTHHHKLPD